MGELGTVSGMKSLQEEHMVLSLRQVVGAKEGASKGPEFIEVVCHIDFTSHALL